MKFKIISVNGYVPDNELDTAYLMVDMWNDYSFVTQFYLKYRDPENNLHNVGRVKIAYRGQTEESKHDTWKVLPPEFLNLESRFFSLGQDVEYYENLYRLPKDIGQKIVIALCDVVLTPDIIEELKSENVFRTSLLREVSLSAIKGQFSRVLKGLPRLTDYKFFFKSEAIGGYSSFMLEFDVKVDSNPGTNIHAIIGRNGVGKTTLLNRMITSITQSISETESNASGFYVTPYGQTSLQPILTDYFSRLVSVSFSVFDPFVPPSEQPDPSMGTCYSYIGLKAPEGGRKVHFLDEELSRSCFDSLKICLNDENKKKRWTRAIESLGSDEVFHSMGLRGIADEYGHAEVALFEQRFLKLFKLMSSGHKVVFYTLTRLVATVEEKTLVLLDEPEGHLHPPLLSAFIRAVSDLLFDRNGVAIIATHSPVVLQELPRSCVWKINRVGKNIHTQRPEIETFGENVGLITSEVFGLEVRRSGFLAELNRFVKQGKAYDQICEIHNNQLGQEARALLKVMIMERDGNA